LINISSGARERLSGIVAAIMLLVFIMFGANLVEQLPMAALTGLMIMVSIGTFEWASLRTINKMPKSDITLMILVTLITAILHNLALAVVVGVILAAVIFAWKNAKHVHVTSSIKEDGSKHYEARGPLFFASVADFAEKFDIANDPNTVYIDFINSRVADMSAIEALNKLTERYSKQGKKVQLKHLSKDCLRLLENAKEIIDVNIDEDPSYKVAVDKI
jgi:SulP family sulfate permease